MTTSDTTVHNTFPPAAVDLGAPRVSLSAARRAAELHADAAQRMRRGKRLVVTGFVVAVLGIIAYCVVCLSAGVSEDLGAAFLESPTWLVGPTLGLIGLGTLSWLLGSFVYLSGAMDSDPAGPDVGL